MNAGGARGNTNRARTRLGSMCILQARNNQAHWGVKKGLCDGCSVVPGENKMSSRSHCQSGAGGKNKTGFIYLFVFFFFPSLAAGGELSVAFKTSRCIG